MSTERRQLYEAIERSEVPRVLALLARLYERAMAGDDIAARLWLDQVRGPVKARDDDAIDMAVHERLVELIQEARRRRQSSSAGHDGPSAPDEGGDSSGER